MQGKLILALALVVMAAMTLPELAEAKKGKVHPAGNHPICRGMVGSKQSLLFPLLYVW